MKILISETQLESLIKSHKEIDEVDIWKHQHFQDCLKSRFTGFSWFPVEVWYNYKGTLNKKEVGEYPFEQDIKSKIDQYIKILERNTLPKDKNYVVIIHKFDIDYKKIDFYSEEDRKDFINNFMKNRGEIYLKTPDFKKCKSSVGDTLVAIIRQNEGVTTFLHRKADGMSAQDFSNRESAISDTDDVFHIKDIDLYSVSKKSSPSFDKSSEKMRFSPRDRFSYMDKNPK